MAKIVPLAYGQYFNLLSLVSPKRTAIKAFSLFCTVRKGKILPQQQEFLDDAKHETHTIGIHKIQTYKWPGNKKTVLLIHGWESNSFRWRNLIEKLKESNFNIIAFDAPGHGYSSGKKLHVPLYAESLKHIIDHYKPQFLVGHSVGGMTILYNQHKHPNTKIDKIITIGAPSEFYEIMEHFQNLLKFNNRVMNALDTYVLQHFGFRIRDFSTSEYARTIATKGILFHDKFDKITPYHASKKVQENWKNSTLVSTEGLGHSMHQEAVNEQLIDFLKA